MQAELESYKRDAARKSPELGKQAAWKKDKEDLEAREAMLRAETEATNDALKATKEEAEALSDSLKKANALIEARSTVPCCKACQQLLIIMHIPFSIYILAILAD